MERLNYVNTELREYQTDLLLIMRISPAVPYIIYVLSLKFCNCGINISHIKKNLPQTNDFDFLFHEGFYIHWETFRPFPN